MVNSQSFWLNKKNGCILIVKIKLLSEKRIMQNLIIECLNKAEEVGLHFLFKYTRFFRIHLM